MPIQDISAIFIAIATVINVGVTIYLATATKLAAEATKQSADAAKATVESANKQLEWTKKNSRGDFLLRLDEAFRPYQDVRARLRDGGDWHRGGSLGKNGPKTSKDWIVVNGYMGLFERIQELIEEETIDIVIADEWYGDRLINIVLNPIIKDRIVNHKKGWSDFITLWKALEHRRKQVSHRWLPDEALVPDELKSN